VSRGMIPPEKLGDKSRDEVTPTENLVPGAPDISGEIDPNVSI